MRKILPFHTAAPGILLLLVGSNAWAGAEAVQFPTVDGIAISAVVALPDNRAEKNPAVIFIHQGGSSKKEWAESRLFESVVNHGLVALAYDVRGHGESGGKADFSTLFDDPDQAPLDLRAAIGYLADTGLVDDSRIAVVGASIGANLAVVSAGEAAFDVKTAVAISGKTSAVFNLAGGRDNVQHLASVFYIASALEQEGQRAKWARELYEVTGDPRLVEIVPKSSGHGTTIFEDDPTLEDRILAWLLETL